MGKPVNIASTSHAQQAELAALLGGPRGTVVADANGELMEANARIEALETANNEGAATVAGLNARIEALETELAAEREAHAKTQAALAAATSAPTGE